jgi:hypothetical protein
MDAFTSDCLEADTHTRLEMNAYRKKVERKEAEEDIIEEDIIDERKKLRNERTERLYQQLYDRVKEAMVKELRITLYQECEKKLRGHIEADLRRQLKPELMATLRKEAYAEMKADASKIVESQTPREPALAEMKLLQLRRQYTKLLTKFRGAYKQMLEYRQEIRSSSNLGACDGDFECSSASELSDSE